MTTAQDVAEVFGATRPVVHSTLVLYFRLSEADSIEVESRLIEWFGRFVQRGSTRELSKMALAKLLVLASCQYGSALRRSAGGGAISDQMNVLSLENLALASALASELEEELTSW